MYELWSALLRPAPYVEENGRHTLSSLASTITTVQDLAP